MRRTTLCAIAVVVLTALSYFLTFRTVDLDYTLWTAAAIAVIWAVVTVTLADEVRALTTMAGPYIFIAACLTIFFAPRLAMVLFGLVAVLLVSSVVTTDEYISAVKAAWREEEERKQARRAARREGWSRSAPSTPSSTEPRFEHWECPACQGRLRTTIVSPVTGRDVEVVCTNPKHGIIV